MRLNRIHRRCISRDTCFPRNEFEEASGKGLVGQYAINWMRHYFRLHCEVMPTTGRLHLSDNYTRDELFQIYKDEMESQGEKYVRYSQFTRLWKMKFDNVMIPRKVRMGVCALCANVKSLIKATRNDDAQREKYKRILKEHRDGQAQERMKAMHHRDKALKCPGRYMCLMIDGMDKKKLVCPILLGFQKTLVKSVLYRCTWSVV